MSSRAKGEELAVSLDRLLRCADSIYEYSGADRGGIGGGDRGVGECTKVKMFFESARTLLAAFCSCKSAQNPILREREEPRAPLASCI